MWLDSQNWDELAFLLDTRDIRDMCSLGIEDQWSNEVHDRARYLK